MERLSDTQKAALYRLGVLVGVGGCLWTVFTLCLAWILTLAAGRPHSSTDPEVWFATFPVVCTALLLLHHYKRRLQDQLDMQGSWLILLGLGYTLQETDALWPGRWQGGWSWLLPISAAVMILVGVAWMVSKRIPWLRRYFVPGRP